MKLDRQLGFLLLGIWLIASGLVPLVNISFNGMQYVLSGLAIGAGALIILKR